MFRSGFTLVISNEEMEDLMKIVKSIKDSGLLITGVGETTKNEAKEQKGGFLVMLLRTLGASLFGNLSTSEGTVRAAKRTIRADKNF